MRLKWFRENAVPKSSISDDNIKELHKKSKELTEKVKDMERSVMDGETQWMLVQCPEKQKPVCRPEPDLEPKPKIKGGNLCSQT